MKNIGLHILSLDKNEGVYVLGKCTVKIKSLFLNTGPPCDSS